ncbi:GerMN domain-containing protein [Acetivibrio saccincola]|uniref:Spore germination protein GerM n=1 Tax=Acetivibrio saccincola TaxID=1677857 RepID=A0A2K9E4W4_9FIRM|nr:GerMN domain-containing protein [Acetivibrio saccincola]AUG58752.1 Spore germination protein GerM [Acetivibrio saccincola]
MKKQLCIIFLCIMIITFIAGMAGCSPKRGNPEDEDLSPASSISLSEEEARQISDKVPINLYFANEDYTKLKLEIRYITISEAKKSVNHLAEIIVNELIKGPKVKELRSAIPPETKLNSKIEIDGDVAIVDFNSEFRDKHPEDKAKEKMTIYSIVNSLTELKEIDKVQFLIEGEKVKEFKGNFRFNNAFPRTTSIISMDTPSIETIKTQEESEEEKDREDKDKEKDRERDDKDGDKREKDEKDKDRKDAEDSDYIMEEEDVFSDTIDEDVFFEIIEGEEF